LIKSLRNLGTGQFQSTFAIVSGKKAVPFIALPFIKIKALAIH